MSTAPRPMKALTVWEPWGSLWCSGVKRHETRSWATSHRGLLAVHAAKRWTEEQADPCTAELARAIRAAGLERRFLAPAAGRCQPAQAKPPSTLGCIVGVVRLVGVLPTLRLWPRGYDLACGNWSPDRWAWRAEDAVLLREPVPCRGARRIWTLPEDVAERVREQVGQDP